MVPSPSVHAEEVRPFERNHPDLRGDGLFRKADRARPGAREWSTRATPEVESATCDDGHRPEFAAALEAARKHISGLMKHKVPFIVAELDADTYILRACILTASLSFVLPGAFGRVVTGMVKPNLGDTPLCRRGRAEKEWAEGYFGLVPGPAPNARPSVQSAVAPARPRQGGGRS